MVTMATAFTGHCHSVRAVIYIFCQLVGGAIGGGLLRVALGKTLADKIHNAGCWIDPEGEVTVWQAASIEFTCAFVLLSVTFLPICWSCLPTVVLLQVLGLRSWIGSPSSQGVWRKIRPGARWIDCWYNVSLRPPQSVPPPMREVGHAPPPPRWLNRF